MRERRLPENQKKLWGAGFGLFLLLLWHLIATVVDAPFILPTPALVLRHLWNNLPELMTVHFPMTMKVVLLGSAIALVLGILFAVLMSLDQRIERAIYPLLTVSQTIPTMCLAPVFILWFGYTTRMRVVLVVLMSFFSIAINVFDGFRSTRREAEELLQTFGAGRAQIFWLLKIPTALPHFFTALKISVPWAVVAAAVSEWFGSPGGLGQYSRGMMMMVNAAGLLAPLVVISFTALGITWLIKFIERRVVTWRNDM